MHPYYLSCMVAWADLAHQNGAHWYRPAMFRRSSRAARLTGRAVQAVGASVQALGRWLSGDELPAELLHPRRAEH